jgi:hypothetical protein
MAYTLEEFCQDCRTALTADNGPGGREAVRGKVEQRMPRWAYIPSIRTRILNLSSSPMSMIRGAALRPMTTVTPGRSMARQANTLT